MTHEKIVVEAKGRVGIISLNNQGSLNALHRVMVAEMVNQIEAWNSSQDIGAIILTGAGRAFCSGADVSGWQRGIAEQEAGRPVETRGLLMPQWPLLCQRSKPIICAINGVAMGAGLTLALPCDVRIASDQARLSMRFIRAGVIPELASTQILAHIVGLGHALELMLSGKIIGAEEAARIGLVNRVVPHERLMAEALDTAEDIAFNPTESLLAIKKLAWENLAESSVVAVMDREWPEFVAAMARPSFKEAVTAFKEKRQPNFHPQRHEG